MIGVVLFGGKIKKEIKHLQNGVHLQRIRTILNLLRKTSCLTIYFAPSKKDFMFNYRVENLVELLEELKDKGVAVMDKIEEYNYGKFGWIMDLDGNKIELWEPKDEAFL